MKYMYLILFLGIPAQALQTFECTGNNGVKVQVIMDKGQALMEATTNGMSVSAEGTTKEWKLGPNRCGNHAEGYEFNFPGSPDLYLKVVTASMTSGCGAHSFLRTEHHIANLQCARLQKNLATTSCRVPPSTDCSTGPKRICCDCSSGKLECS